MSDHSMQADTRPDYRALIAADDLQRLLGRDDVRIVDCRFDLADPSAGRRCYARQHISGATFFDLDLDLSAPVGVDTGRHPMPDASELAQVFGRAGIDESVQVVLYDEGNGALASRAWWLLRWAGHERSAILDGGLTNWVRSGGPVATGEERVAARSFVISPRPELVVETAEIIERLSDGSGMALVDARDEQRFRGDNEPIDAIAGHIPGALNLPFARCLNEDGSFRSAEELEKVWLQTLGRGNDRQIVVMCGSGVTACHLVLTALLAGLSEPRVYVGSWSEWIRDPGRPVALGPI